MNIQQEETSKKSNRMSIIQNFNSIDGLKEHPVINDTSGEQIEYNEVYNSLLSGVLSAGSNADAIKQNNQQEVQQMITSQAQARAMRKNQINNKSNKSNKGQSVAPQRSNLQVQPFMNEDNKSIQSLGKSSLKSNKSAISRIINIKNMNKESRSLSTKSVNRPQLIGIKNLIGQTPLNESVLNNQAGELNNIIAIKTIQGNKNINLDYLISPNTMYENNSQINPQNNFVEEGVMIVDSDLMQSNHQDASSHGKKKSVHITSPGERPLSTSQEKKVIKYQLHQNNQNQNEGQIRDQQQMYYGNIAQQKIQNQFSNQSTNSKKQVPFKTEGVMSSKIIPQKQTLDPASLNMLSSKSKNIQDQKMMKNMNQASNLSLKVNSNNPLNQNQNSLAQIKQVNDNLQNVYFNQLQGAKHFHSQMSNSSLSSQSVGFQSIQMSSSHKKGASKKKNITSLQSQPQQTQGLSTLNILGSNQNKITILKNQAGGQESSKGRGKYISVTKSENKQNYRKQIILDSSKFSKQEKGNQNEIKSFQKDNKITRQNIPIDDKLVNSGTQPGEFLKPVQRQLKNRITPVQIENLNQSSINFESVLSGKSVNPSKLSQHSSSPQKQMLNILSNGRNDDPQIEFVNNDDQFDVGNHQLTLYHQNKSEVPIFNANNITVNDSMNQGNITVMDHISSSAQPMASRIMMNLNQVKSKQNKYKPIHESLDNKNLQLNIQDENIIDMILSQQKSNKNASVKSGKRPGIQNTSATNKRKKSIIKKKNNQSGANQQFSIMTQSTKGQRLESETAKMKMKKGQSIKFQTQIDDIDTFNTIMKCGKGSNGSISSAKRYTKQTRQQNTQHLNTGSKSPNHTSKGRQQRFMKNIKENQMTNILATRAQEDYEKINKSLMNVSDIQDQQSIIINNLNNSTFSNAEYKEIALLSADLETQKHKRKASLENVAQIMERQDLNSIFNQSQFTEQQNTFSQGIPIKDKLEKKQSKMTNQLKGKVNISQISPHKLGEFFQNNILYSKSSKNNSISLSYMIDENDLNPRHIFEQQPKTNKNANRKGHQQTAKSPNSNSRIGKANKANKQRKTSRQDTRITRKSNGMNTNNKRTQRNLSNEMDEITSQSKTKKITRKSQPLTATNFQANQTIQVFSRDFSEERHNTIHTKRETQNLNIKPSQNSKNKNSKQNKQLMYDTFDMHQTVNNQNQDTAFQKLRNISDLHKNIKSGEKYSKRLSLDIAEVEASYKEQIESGQQNIRDKLPNQLNNQVINQNQKESQIVLNQNGKEEKIQNQQNQKMADKITLSKNNKKNNQITYIFNNAEELKQQEQNLQHLSTNMRPRQVLGKPAGKLAALNSKYEQIDLTNIQMNKINSDNNLLSNQKDQLQKTENDLEITKIKRKNSQLKKLKLLNTGKMSSHSLQERQRNSNKHHTKIDQDNSFPSKNLIYDSQGHYSVYEQPINNSFNASKIQNTVQKTLPSFSQERVIYKQQMMGGFGTTGKQSERSDSQNQPYSNIESFAQKAKESGVKKQLVYHLSSGGGKNVHMMINSTGRKTAQDYARSNEDSQMIVDYQGTNYSKKTSWRNTSHNLSGNLMNKHNSRVSARSLSNYQKNQNGINDMQSKLVNNKFPMNSVDRPEQADIIKLMKKRQINTESSRKSEQRNMNKRKNFTNVFPDQNSLPPHVNSSFDWRTRSAVRDNSQQRQNGVQTLMNLDNQVLKKQELSVFKPQTNNFFNLNNSSPIKIQRKNLNSTTENQTSLQKPTKKTSGLQSSNSPFVHSNMLKKDAIDSSLNSDNKGIKFKIKNNEKPLNSQQVYYENNEETFDERAQNYSVTTQKLNQMIKNQKSKVYHSKDNTRTFVLKLQQNEVSNQKCQDIDYPERKVKQTVITKTKVAQKKNNKILKISKSNYDKDPLLNKLDETSDAASSHYQILHTDSNLNDVYQDENSVNSTGIRSNLLNKNGFANQEQPSEPLSANAILINKQESSNKSLKFENESHEQLINDNIQLKNQNQNNMDPMIYGRIKKHNNGNGQDIPFQIAQEALGGQIRGDKQLRAQTALEHHQDMAINQNGLRTKGIYSKNTNMQASNSMQISYQQNNQFGPRPSLINGSQMVSRAQQLGSPQKTRQQQQYVQKNAQYQTIYQDTNLQQQLNINDSNQKINSIQRNALNNQLMQQYSKNKHKSNKSNVSNNQSSQQKSMRNYQNYVSNNHIENEINSSFNGSNNGGNMSNSLQPKINQQIMQTMTSHKNQNQSLNSRLKINNMITNNRGGAQTAHKMYSQFDNSNNKQSLIESKSQQNQVNDSKMKAINTSNYKNVMNALKVFGSQASPGGAASIKSGSRNQPLCLSAKSQPLRVNGNNQNAKSTVFSHQCTVEDVHKNTITDICLLQNQAFDFQNQQNSQSMRHLFTSSNDSTIKFWSFYDANDNSNRSIESQNAPPHVPQIDQLHSKVFNYNEGTQKLQYEFNEIQQNGRKRVKINSMVYMPNLDLLVTGGTDRFINLYSNQQSSLRYKCTQKITKQGANSVVNSMCAIDSDKLLVGQTDEYIRLYQIPNYGMNQMDDDDIASSLESPLTVYKFEDSGINNLCSLNDKNLFISSGFNRSISVWDTRQTQPILFFKDIHYDKITAIDKFNTEIFASASEDGYVNLWDLRMGEFIKQLKVDNNETISSIKFVNAFSGQLGLENISTPRKGDYNYNSANQHLLIAHSDKISILSAKDNFTKRHTFSIGDQMSNESEGTLRINQMQFSEEEQMLYLGLQSTSQRSQRNLLSIWNLNLNVI